MKNNLWMCCLLAFLPGCLNQTHYNELMGMTHDVQMMKEHNKKQDQRIDHMEKLFHQLRSSLRLDIKNSGVKVEPVKVSRVAHRKASSGKIASTVHTKALASDAIKVVKAIDAVKVTMPQAVLFASGSTRINHIGGSVLARMAHGLKGSPETGLIRIVGHSDARPIGIRLRHHFKDNWELSAARAAAVARVFIWGDHIRANRIRVEGRSAMDPVADDATVAGRAKNRRIEIFIEQAG